VTALLQHGREPGLRPCVPAPREFLHRRQIAALLDISQDLRRDLRHGGISDTCGHDDGEPEGQSPESA
jgi:hypothetical protein